MSLATTMMLSYLNRQKKDALLYCTLALSAGYKITPFQKAFDLVWKALRFVCQHQTPTAAQVKEDLKL